MKNIKTKNIEKTIITKTVINNDSVIKSRLSNTNFSLFINDSLKKYIRQDSLKYISFGMAYEDLNYNRLSLNYSATISICIYFNNSSIKIIDKNNIPYYPKNIEEFYDFTVYYFIIYENKEIVFSTNPKIWNKNKIGWHN